jgi:hypothetical protein
LGSAPSVLAVSGVPADGAVGGCSVGLEAAGSASVAEAAPDSDRLGFFCFAKAGPENRATTNGTNVRLSVVQGIDLAQSGLMTSVVSSVQEARIGVAPVNGLAK